MMRRIFFRDIAAGTGTLLTLFMMLFMLIGPLLNDYDPVKVNMAERLLPPGAEHWLGTDELGRDIWARLTEGAKYSLGSGFLIIASALAAGVIIGGFAGLAGGRIDEIVMRVCDVFMAFPQLLLAMIIAFSLGAGLQSTIIALALSWWPAYARMTRGLVLLAREQLYVEAAVAAGASLPYVLFRSVLPNALPVLFAQATMDIGSAIIVGSGLSFIGLGAQQPTPEWGAMIAASRQYVFEGWWYGLSSGLAIFISSLGFSLLGDALQDALDPRGRGSGGRKRGRGERPKGKVLHAEDSRRLGTPPVPPGPNHFQVASAPDQSNSK